MRIARSGLEKAHIVEEGLSRDHHYYEKMAHHISGRLASVPYWTGRRITRDFAEDISITVYYPTRHYKPPVLVFGNTRADFVSPSEGNELEVIEQARLFMEDMSANLFPLGIGFYRYCFNEGSIKQLIESLISTYKENIVLVGHSLGGALAQITACRLPQYVNAVITFQSPMANSNVVQTLYNFTPKDMVEYLELNSWHYRVTGDEVIQQAGDFLSPGSSYKFTFGNIISQAHNPILYSYLAHTRLIFEDFDGVSSIATIRQICEREIIQIEAEVEGDPATRLRSLENEIIEWIRANIAGMAHAAIQTVSAHSLKRMADTSPLVAIIVKMLYVMDWDVNTLRFKDYPVENSRRIESLSFTWPVFGITTRIDQLLNRQQLLRFRAEFRKYTADTTVRS